MAKILPVLNESMAIFRHFPSDSLSLSQSDAGSAWSIATTLASTPSLPGLLGLLQPTSKPPMLLVQPCWPSILFIILRSTPCYTCKAGTSYHRETKGNCSVEEVPLFPPPLSSSTIARSPTPSSRNMYNITYAQRQASSTSHGRKWNFHNYMQHAICKSPHSAADMPTLECTIRDDTDL